MQHTEVQSTELYVNVRPVENQYARADMDECTARESQPTFNTSHFKLL